MTGHPIDTFTGEFGLKAIYGYDNRTAANDPRLEDHPWRFLRNEQAGELEHLDGSYDAERFYDLDELTDWIRGNHDAWLLAPLRWESHGPMGQLKINEKIGPDDTLTYGRASEAIAVVSQGIYSTDKEAFEKLDEHLDRLSQWFNGWIYRFVVLDHRDEVVASKGNIYGDQLAAQKARAALTIAETQMAREVIVTDEWAARDVITINPVPGSVGSR